MSCRVEIRLRLLATLCAACAVIHLMLPAPARAVALSEWVHNPATGHYYSVVATVTWTVAERVAQQVGGHLATVNDDAEDVWLSETFTAPNLYIGLNDYAAEGVWVWSSGDASAYRGWVEGEPNNFKGTDVRGENYTVMNWTDPDGQLGWNDWSDSVGPLAGIIEVSTVPTRSPAVVARPSAPAVVRPGQRFTAASSIRPWHPAGSRAVRFVCDRLESGRWVRRASFDARISDFSTFSRADAQLKLTKKGVWRVRAYHAADWLHTSSWGSGRVVRVR